MQQATQSRADVAPGPLDGHRFSRLAEAIEGLSRDQLNWVSGYVAGLVAHPEPLRAVKEAQRLTILYASQGGNARGVAEGLAADAGQRGLAPRLVSVERYRPRDLGGERLLVVVISTQGEGEPPESARELFRYLNGKKPPNLDHLEYAICGLGDSSYEFFNQAAKDLDQRLQTLGARSVAARIDADVDYQAAVGDWCGVILQHAQSALPADATQVIPLQRPATAGLRHDRRHPYRAVMVDQRRITTPDAVSGVHHLAFEIDPETLSYRPGDAVGVLADNDPALVDEILRSTGLAADATVHLQGESLSLSAALHGRLELTQLHPGVVAGWAAISGAAALLGLGARGERLRRFASRRQLVDLLREYPAEIDADGLARLLRPLQPRLYSIASSQALYADEVHLTVATVQYRVHTRHRLGAASGHVNLRLAEGDTQPIYIAENPTFRLPQDGDRPIVMVGAGTGIAPYRAFLQQREAQGSRGHNWLVFGNRHFHRDFLYQTDWLGHRDAGRLHRVSLAFSRDSADRPYVQDRLLQEGDELYRWLEDGAHLYVCGGLAMEKAVCDTLLQVARTHGGLADDAAIEFIDNLRVQGRYLKDVY
jgi:sulfite reductase (NADPH) flavoprotein alpha-component